MRKYITAISILIFSIQTFGGLSAIRSPNESYQEVRSRFGRKQLQGLPGSGKTPEDLQAPLSDLDIKKIPEVADLPALISSYQYVRDIRFIKTKNRFLRRITWLYPDDGCYARAELISQILQEKKQPAPAKIFAFGSLSVKTENSPTGSVSWWYHVATTYRIDDVAYVLDPAIESRRPLKLAEWAAAIGVNDTDVKFALCSAKTFDPDFDCESSQGVDRKHALSEQSAFLSPEWSRVRQLGHDPNLYLGEQPPWSQP